MMSNTPSPPALTKQLSDSVTSHDISFPEKLSDHSEAGRVYRSPFALWLCFTKQNPATLSVICMFYECMLPLIDC